MTTANHAAVPSASKGHAFLRRFSLAATIVVATASAWLSFDAISNLAEAQGFNAQLSWLLPVCIDGTILASGMLNVANALSNQRSFFPWTVLGIASALSVWANASTSDGTFTGLVVHATPSVMLLMSLEASMLLLKRKIVETEALQAAAAQHEAAEAAKAERTRIAAENARARAEATAQADREKAERAAARATAEARLEAIVGKRKPAAEGAAVAKIRSFAETFDGWDDLPIARRVQVLIAELDASTTDIVNSGVAALDPTESRSATMKRVSKARGRFLARQGDENTGGGGRRQLHAVSA